MTARLESAQDAQLAILSTQIQLYASTVLLDALSAALPTLPPAQLASMEPISQALNAFPAMLLASPAKAQPQAAKPVFQELTSIQRLLAAKIAPETA